MRRALGLLIVAAVLAVVHWLYAMSTPWWIEALGGDQTAFRIVSAAYIVGVVSFMLAR